MTRMDLIPENNTTGSPLKVLVGNVRISGLALQFSCDLHYAHALLEISG